MGSRRACRCKRLLLSLLLAGASASAQDPEQANRPRFRAQVRVLQVDVVVTDGNGDFVPGLGVEDFELFENGETREITTFHSIELPKPAASLPADVRDDALVAPSGTDFSIATNEGAESGRLFALVLDDLHVDARRSGPIRELTRDFVRRSLGPNDLVSISFTSGRWRPFTTSRTTLLANVETFMGKQLRSSTIERIEFQAATTNDPMDAYMDPPSELQRGQRNLTTLRFLGAQCEFLESIPGRRKALVWIGEGLDYDINSWNGRPYAESIVDAFNGLLDRAARANVAIYAINPRGLGTINDDLILLSSGAAGVPTVGVNNSIYTPEAGFASEDPFLGTASLLNDRATALRSLRRISELTGGTSFTQTNDLAGSLDRIVEETGRYYLLGFTPESASDSTELAELEVRVKRDGLVARARRGFAPAGDQGDGTDENFLADASTSEIREAARQPVPVTGLALKVAAAPMGQDGEHALVPVVVTSGVADFQFDKDGETISDEVELWIGAFGLDGELADSTTRRVSLNVPSDLYPRLLEDGFRAMGMLRLAAGTYQLRVAVHESGAALTGSVLTDLEVPEPDDGVLRGAALSSIQQAQIPVAGYDREKTSLPTPITTTRLFHGDDELLAYIEVANPDERSFNLVLEILDPSGRSVKHVEGKAPGTREETVAVLSMRVALGTLAPDDYRLAIRAVDAEGKDIAERRVNFTVQ